MLLRIASVLLARAILAMPTGGPEFGITQHSGAIREPLDTRDLSALTLSDNVLALSIIPPTPPVRRRDHEVEIWEPTDQQTYAAKVSVGGTQFNLLVDTGSDLLWVPASNATCQTIDGDSCTWSTATTLSIPEGEKWLDEFDYSYMDTSMLSGGLIERRVSMAGINVENQVIGAVYKTKLLRPPDSSSNGILGLRPQSDFKYPPIWETIMDSGKLKKMFGVALLGTADFDATREHGYLAFGGIPKETVPIKSKTVGVPMSLSYHITIDGFRFENAAEIVLSDEDRDMVVDTGAFLTYVPWKVAEAVYHLFPGNPTSNMLCPNKLAGDEKCFTPSGGLYVPCDSKPPVFEVQIGGISFPFAPENIIVTTESGLCFAGIANSTGPGGSLGTTFLKNNILAVYDFTGTTPTLHFANYDLAQ